MNRVLSGIFHLLFNYLQERKSFRRIKKSCFFFFGEKWREDVMNNTACGWRNPQKKNPLKESTKESPKKEPFSVSGMESFPYLEWKVFCPWDGKFSVPHFAGLLFYRNKDVRFEEGSFFSRLLDSFHRGHSWQSAQSLNNYKLQSVVFTVCK